MKDNLEKIVIESSSKCNFSCKHCPITYNDDPKDFDLSLLNNLENAIRSCKEVSLFGWGEPLCNPDFPDIISRIREISHSVKIYFTTNGSLLNKDLCDFFINKKVDFISISLDNTEVDKLRTNSLNSIISNIKYMLKNKKNVPHIRFTMTLSTLNINKLKDMIRFSHSIGIKELNCVFLTAFFESMRKFTLEFQDKKVKKIFQDSKELAESLNITLKLPEHKNSSCITFKNEVLITSKGNVKPCICYPISLGNIANNTLEKILNSKRYQNELKKIKEKEICDFCFKCQYLDIQNGQGFSMIDTNILNKIFNT